MASTQIERATTRTVFPDLPLFGEVPVLRVRRTGNVILLAGNIPMIKPGKHDSVLRGSDLGIFTGGARPLLDEPR